MDDAIGLVDISDGHTPAIATLAGRILRDQPTGRTNPLRAFAARCKIAMAGAQAGTA